MEPRLKVVFALIAVVITSAVPSWFYPLSPRVPISLLHLAIACGLMIALQLAQVPFGYVLLRLAVFAPFVLLLSLSIPFSRGLEDGWPLMAGVLVRALLSWTTVLLLVNITPFDQLLAAFRQLGMPLVLVATLSFHVPLSVCVDG